MDRPDRTASALRAGALAALACTLACQAALPYDGLAPAVDKGGPKVRFDLLHKPLPEIPFPNDLATRPDPLSPTGLRLNAALLAPTRLEANVRGLLDQLDGFGTYAPISVAFDSDLDVLDLWTRQNDADPSNDGVYLIDLTTGLPVALDFNGGHFPLELVNPHGYFLNDPMGAVTNLLFPVTGPSANFLHPVDPLWPQAHGGVPQAADDLMGFYERSTHTLLARPVVPLEQQRRYAVVLTDALRDTAGRPVSSPFPGVNHAAQTRSLEGLPALLPAGVPLSRVTFTWSFTTQSTTRDLEAIRAGLNGDFESAYGHGPLGQLAVRFPVVYFAGDGYSTLRIDRALPAGDNPYLLPASKLSELLADPQIAALILGGSQAEVKALQDTLAYVDYFVSGTFESPDFLSDPDRIAGDTAFQLDLKRGTARAQPVRIPFFLAVPKTDLAHFHKPPFPTVLTFHSYKSARLEQVIGFAGTFAKFGLASISIDAYGHGLGLPPVLEALARAVLSSHGLPSWPACRPADQPAAPYQACSFADSAFTRTRARDLDADGVKDPGGDFWTADSFHTRDTVRQSIVDWLQLSRLLRSFNGNFLMLHDAAPKGWAVAGDFNLDGIPDVGGGPTFAAAAAHVATPTYAYAKGDPNPGVDQFAFGISLGGVLSAILPAVEPNVRAGMTGSGAGGLSDVGVRSDESGVRAAVFLELFGPLLATCNWSVSDQSCDGAGGVPSLVWNTLRVNEQAVVPVAPLTLKEGDVVTACNLTQLTGLVPGDALLVKSPPEACRQARAQAGGALRLPLGADGPQTLTSSTPQSLGLPDKVAVSLVHSGDRVKLLIQRGGASAAPEVLDTFQYATKFYGVDYRKGDALRAVGRGYGHDRNDPEVRRSLQLSQTILEPGDPINYAPHYFQDPLPARQGLPVNMLIMPTAGDPWVPTSTGIAMARAAGLVELNVNDADYGMPIDRVLIAAGAVEGVARLRRFEVAAGGPRARLPGHIRCGPDNDCSGEVLADVNALACDENGKSCLDDLAAPRLFPPLRAQLQRTTRTRDGNVVGLSMLELPLLTRTGQHGFKNPQPQKAFDLDQFLANQIGHYFETKGRELSFDRCQQELASCPWIFPAVP